MTSIMNMIRERKLNWLLEVLLFSALAVIPLQYGSQAYIMGLVTLVLIYNILLIGLDVSVGYLGQLNLAQTAFLAIGAYTGAILATTWHLDLVSCLFLAFALTFVIGALLAIPALHLYGPQFALATLSFTTLTATVLNEWESLTNGAQGLSLTRPLLFGFSLDSKNFYWFCLVMVIMIWIGMRNFLRSQWGRAFQALRDSPIATDAMGIGAMHHKIIALAIGSGIGGIAGALYAFNLQYLQPLSFSYDLMVLLLLGIVLGGRQSLWGAFIGAALVTLLPNLLSKPIIFQSIATIGFILALSGVGLALKKGKSLDFTKVAPLIALTALFIGSFVSQNLEDWRKGIFAILLFSSVVGLPEGLIGYIEKQIYRYLKLKPHKLPSPYPLDDVLPILHLQEKDKLEVDHIKRYFGGVKAVDDVSFTVNPGQILGVIGPNGSGKSTLMNVISGFYTPTEGYEVFEEQVLPKGSLLKVSKRHIARTFQNIQLFNELSTLENVMSSLRDTYTMPWFAIMAGFGGKEERIAQSKALALLEFVGLEKYALITAKNLPYGAKRLLEIARALATKPHILILDEPAAGMSKPDAINLKRVITKIRERGITILLIEHRMDFISELCDEVLVLQSGRVIAKGTPDAIKNDSKVIEAYLGEKKVIAEVMNEPEENKPRPDEIDLRVNAITASYGLGEILVDLDIKVAKGEIVVMIGANGVGKTTSMRVISGQLPPSSGNVSLFGQDITHLPAHLIVRKGLSHTPEGRGIFTELSVEDNLLLGAYTRLPGIYGYKKQAEKDLEAIYKLFPLLRQYKKRVGGTLSGGEQQMLAIGRSLMSKPKILLLDEPSLGLAPIVIDDVFKTIRELNQQGISILLVEQFAGMALSVAHYVYVIEHGHVAIEGTAQQLSKDEKVLKAYLGE